MLLHKDKMLINSSSFDTHNRAPAQHTIVLFSNDENDWEIGIFAGIITRVRGFSDAEVSFLGHGINERANIEHEYKFCRVPDYNYLPTVLVTQKDGTSRYVRVWGSSNPSNYIVGDSIEIKRKDYEND